jgi:uncharacterized membrane protein YfcA
VPVMMQVGVSPHVAVATNMLTLVFLSLGGTIPFLKGQFIPRQRLPVLIGLALLGSIIGALVLLVVPARAIPVVIASAMLLVAGFSLTKHNAGVSVIGDPNRVSKKTVNRLIIRDRQRWARVLSALLVTNHDLGLGSHHLGRGIHELL